MRAFADLYAALDETTRTTRKVRALADYFRAASAADAAWAVYFLSGRKPRQVVPTKKLRAWALELTGLSDWLFDESYHAVGDLAEAIVLLLPANRSTTDEPLYVWVEDRLLPLRDADEATQKSVMLRAWDSMNDRQRFVWNKLITGAFRVGVSQQLVIRALAEVSGVPSAAFAHRLMGQWEPTPAFYERLVAPSSDASDPSRPYPFFLAHPLDGDPTTLGDRADWQAEWKWDGIRAQLVRREGQAFLWSRGEELIGDRFPEIVEAAGRLPDGTVIDGEVLPWRDGVLPFAQLQRRIGRKTVSRKLLADVPVVLLAYDLLEHEGRDARDHDLDARRKRLEAVVAAAAHPRLLLSEIVSAPTWDALALVRGESRERNVEGLMLKRRVSPYRVGRMRGDWWKWKVQPLTMDAVLVYAQRGSGKRASLYTDYTFAVWDGGQLVPVAKAYSGLTDDEIRQVDRFVRANTVDKFGPVRSVKPELVFELAFEGIQRSSRHRSGVAVRFPRILRQRTDKPAAEADTLAALLALIPPEGSGPAQKELFS